CSRRVEPRRPGVRLSMGCEQARLCSPAPVDGRLHEQLRTRADVVGKATRRAFYGGRPSWTFREVVHGAAPIGRRTQFRWAPIPRHKIDVHPGDLSIGDALPLLHGKVFVSVVWPLKDWRCIGRLNGSWLGGDGDAQPDVTLVNPSPGVRLERG